MSPDIISTVVLMTASSTRELTQIAVLRKQQQMQAAMLQIIDDATRNAPPPAGQGAQVDKRA